MTLVWPAAALAVTTVLIGLGVEPVFTLSQRAADQLLNPAAYITAVMEARP
jgi:multicomponent Na+:H+ antiporter subunit D